MSDAKIVKDVADRIFSIADQIDWTHLSITDRSKYYEAWAEDPEIGGRLSQIMDSSRIRVYLKDSIIGSYAKSKRTSLKPLLQNMNVTLGSNPIKYIKPQALLCEGVRLYTLTEAKHWRVAITSAYERATDHPLLEKNLVIFTEHINGRFGPGKFRDMVEDIAGRLDVELWWLT